MSEVLPPPEDVAGRLARAVGQIARRIRPSSGELSMGHFSTLASIERRTGCRPSDLARVERVSPPTMTRILATLESRGLIVRRPSSGDARALSVELTGQGRAVVRQTRRDRTATVRELLARLDPDQRRRLTDALEALEQVAAAAAAPATEQRPGPANADGTGKDDANGRTPQ
ncbi:MarR family winged helix-turn-helix transcriptional regulator [Nakamurella lactea]|uniref:MarR family winged helix-turn-helix transcriptional regulator n=1 Tax=Nakamurella lactea TaxID=459515 RepID=UPI0003FA789F|nr:MarR family transcriptional regulator [Nakamurella lactea]